MDESGRYIILRFYAQTYDSYDPQLFGYEVAKHHVLPLLKHLKTLGVDMDLSNYQGRRTMIDEYTSIALQEFKNAKNLRAAEEILKEYFNLEATERLFDIANNPAIAVRGARSSRAIDSLMQNEPRKLT